MLSRTIFFIFNFFIFHTMLGFKDLAIFTHFHGVHDIIQMNSVTKLATKYCQKCISYSFWYKLVFILISWFYYLTTMDGVNGEKGIHGINAITVSMWKDPRCYLDGANLRRAVWKGPKFTLYDTSCLGNKSQANHHAIIK